MLEGQHQLEVKDLMELIQPHLDKLPLVAEVAEVKLKTLQALEAQAAVLVLLGMH